jgi:hypothetical protein
VSRRLAACLVCLVAGLGLMLFSELTVTRVLGVLALFAFVVIGVFTIADPEFLARDDDDG